MTLFAPSSIWNKPLPTRDDPLDPNSAATVANLASLAVHSATLNTTAYSIPVITVPDTQPLVKVLLNKQGGERNPLQLAWLNIPVPPGVVGAKGSDGSLVISQPSKDMLFEFWQFTYVEGQPAAGWGGAMQNVSTNLGYYDVNAWPKNILQQKAFEEQVRMWGGSGSSFALLGGLVTIEECRRKKVDHALAMAVPNTRAKALCLPAQRTDGRSTASTSIPMGAHFKIDPLLDLSQLSMPGFTRMLAEAAQKYGIVVRDTSSAIPIYLEDPTPTGANPYTGPGGFFEGHGPPALLAAFPWKHLQLRKMTLV